MTKFLLNLFGISFLLNFVWEIFQMDFYAAGGMGVRADYGQFLAIHWRVSFLDAAMVVCAYALIAIFSRTWDWAATVNVRWAMFAGVLVFWQAGIEYYSVHVVHRWAYAPAMPVVFGIGAVPLAQMAVLPIVALAWSRFLRR